MTNSDTPIRGAAVTRRRVAALLASTTALAGLPRLAQSAGPGDRIRKLVLYSAAQASDPQEFQAASLLAAAWKQLGLEIELRPMPRQQLSDVVWNQREKWDMTMWRMIGRPERSDPDELVSSLFNSQLAATGYDFIGYVNAAYDKVAEAQRQELDRDKRQVLVREAQDMIDKDQPYIFLVFPKNNYGFLNTVWKPDSFVEQGGIGIRCFWSFLAAEPVGAQKDMIVNASEALVSLNPLYIAGAIDSWVTELVWDRLVRIAPDGTATPWSAEKTEWKDTTTLDVTLRAGQKWHDGQPVTVEDVVFSFQAPAGTMAPMYKPFVSNIADVAAVDDKTVRFKLKAPNAGFLVTSLGKVNLTPRHIWEPLLKDLAAKGQTAEQYQEKAPIGSGPFRIARFNLTEEVVLEANEAHWRKPKMSRWIMRVVTNNDAALGMLRRGELNFLADYRGDPRLLADLAKQDPSVSVVSTTDMGFRFVAPNERRPPFNDAAFRRALSASTNRPMIAAAAWQGFAVPANSMIAPSLSFWAKPDIDKVKFDVSEAKKLLQDAGYSVVGGHLCYPSGVKETLTGS